LAPLLERLGAAGEAARRKRLQAIAALTRAVARYLLEAKAPDGKPADPVARFHLANGARLERVNPAADTSDHAVRQSGGVMVNYVHDRAKVEANRTSYQSSSPPNRQRAERTRGGK